MKNPGRKTTLCVDCKAVEPDWPNVVVPTCVGHQPGAFLGTCPGCDVADQLTIFDALKEA